MPPVVTLSIEIELGWGTMDAADLSKVPVSRHRKAETEFLDRLLSVADQSGIPITFDVVGHLLNESCDGSHPGPYATDRFENDPGTDTATDPVYYAPDMIEQIVDASVDHELATHTFSHIHCETESDEVLDIELERAIHCHREFGLPAPRAMVAPYHEDPSYDVVQDNQIEILRVPFPDYTTPEHGVRRFGWNLLGSHPHRGSQVEDGLIETYCTPQPSLTAGFLKNGTREPRSEYQYLPLRIRQYLHFRSLVRAVKSASTAASELHLWTHLYNLSNEQQWRPLKKFLEWLASYRDKGNVRIEPMEGLIKTCT